MRKPWRIDGWDQTIFEYTFRAELEDYVVSDSPKQMLICEWLNGTDGFDGVAVRVTPEALQRGGTPVLREIKSRLLWQANKKRGLVGKMYAEYIK